MNAQTIATKTLPTIDYSFPYPEANVLSRLDEMAFQIGSSRIVTVDVLAVANNIVPRVARYYGDALCFLGLAIAVETYDSSRKAYMLSEAGQSYVTMSVLERMRVLKNVIDSCDVVSVVRQHGPSSGVKSVMEKVGGTVHTAEKKIHNMKTWIRQMDEGNFIKEQSLDFHKASMERASTLFESNRCKGVEKKEEKHGEVCPTCFMEMPLIGECAMCD